MNAPSQTERFQLVHDELNALLETVLTGDLIENRAAAKRFVCFLGAAVSLHERHAVDQDGRCALCRPTGRCWRWRRRQRCSVHTEFAFYLAQPSSLAIGAFSDIAMAIKERTESSAGLVVEGSVINDRDIRELSPGGR